MAVQTQIQVRRGTASSWSSTNPTLAAGEIGFESDTGKIKVGTGSATWNSLTYIGAANAIQYVYTASAGQTTFSGADNNSLTLSYTVGAEQVYVNGVLQVRGTDYTATNGTSVVLTTATIASDIVTIIAYGTFTVADTYTQAQANAAFTLNTNNNAAGKNSLINGAFDFWQRGTSFALTATAAYTADRWGAYRNGTTGATLSRQTTSDTTNLPNIQYCARVQRDSGNTSTAYIDIVNSFETVNSIPLAGKTVTLSFYARAGSNYSAASNALTVYFISGTGTDQNRASTSYTGEAYPILGQTATLTTTWQRFSFTGSVGATATELAALIRFTPVGTASTNDYYEITGVQLELGSVATAFGRAQGTIQGELAACQRYYYRVSNTATGAANASVFGNAWAYSSTLAYVNVPFPVTLRVAPTSMDATTAGLYRVLIGGTAYTNSSAPTLDVASDKFALVQFNNAGTMTVGQAGVGSANSATATYLGFSAEL